MKSNRYRWNLAHELGHIVLGHHKDSRTRLFRNGLSATEYTQYEEDADWFAAYILVPHVILNEMLDGINPYQLRIHCGISKDASQYRYHYLKKWMKNNAIYDEFDRKLLQLYSHKKYVWLVWQNWMTITNSVPSVEEINFEHIINIYMERRK